MTVSVQTPTSSQAANGVTTDFPFAYKVRSASDLVVTLVDASGNETAQTLGVHYTVSGVGTSSGTVSFLAAPANGLAVRTRRVTALSRSTDYQSNGDLLAAVLNGDVDAVWLALQELLAGAQIAGNVLRGPTGETLNPVVSAALRAGKYLTFDASGNPVAASGTGNDTALRTDLAATGGSALISFRRSDIGAASRSLQARLSDYLNAKDFGVTGDGVTNDTAAINNALAAAFLANRKLYCPAGTYRYAEASLGAGYALLNRGVSVVGDGMFTTVFAPLATMPNTADFMLVNPNANADISGLEFGHFFVNPKFDGTVRGRKGIYLLFNVVANLSKLHVHNICIRDCNDFAMEVANNIVLNSQGVPAYSCVENNLFYDGLKFVGIGDSNTVHGNFLNTPVGSGRVGIHLYHVDGGGGVSSHTTIYDNAIVCSGGALFVDRGRNIKFFHNNVEQSHGPGSNTAIVDINGAGGAVPGVEVKGNHFGVFGTTTVSSIVRFNGTTCAEAENNTILSGFAITNCFLINSPATDTYIGRNAVDTSKFTNVVNDQGARTAGVQKTLTITAGGVAATGSGYAAPAYFKDKEGTVSLKGAVSGAAIANNTILATLPAGYQPAAIERFVSTGTVAGGAVSCVVEIDTSGNLKFITESGGAATFASLGGIRFTTTPIVLGTT